MSQDTPSEMLQLTDDSYRVKVANDPTYSLGSTDNLHRYSHEYLLDVADGDYVSSRHSVSVTSDGTEIASCILLAGGGATGVHEHTALIHGGSCLVVIGPYVVSLLLPALELQWVVKADSATCFGLYHSDSHRCFISHGELEITRLSYDGDVVWQSGAADIFTNGFALHGDCVQVVDFNDQKHKFDIHTGRDERHNKSIQRTPLRDATDL